MAELIDVPPGLAGVAVADTEIGDVVGGAGFYHYRGVTAPELARTATFEAAAALVLDGSSDPIAGDRTLPQPVADMVATADLRTGLSALGVALGCRPLDAIGPDERRNDAVRLIATMPTLVASILHRTPIAPDPGLGHVADYLRMIRGEPATDEHVAALQSYLVLTIDHGFNNSTFATRVVASTGVDLAACAVAGLCSLSGPRHGAELERILDMFDEIGEPDRAEAWMRSELEARRRLHGFGHAVYERPDPRLVLMRELGAAIAPERHRVAMAAEEAGTKLLAGRRLVPNIDLHAGVVLDACGIPRGWHMATFAVARIVGWCAHAIEQAAERRIFRPAARYIGPPPEIDVY